MKPMRILDTLHRLHDYVAFLARPLKGQVVVAQILRGLQIAEPITCTLMFVAWIRAWGR